jgi:NitT/TauT family transport system permease protein
MQIFHFNKQWPFLISYGILLVLVILTCSYFFNALEFVHNNPTFPLWKGGNSNLPYAIGIVNSMIATPVRVLVGTTIGFLLGTLFGILAASIVPIRPLLLVPCRLLAPIAPLAWLPLVLIQIGSAEIASIIIVAVGNLFVISIATYMLLINMEPRYADILRAFGANDWQLLCRAQLPSAIPMLLVLLRLEIFAGWMAVLAAEMSGVESGLGSLLLIGRSLSNTSIIALACSLIAVIAGLMDFGIARLTRLLIYRKYGGWLFAKL